LGEQVRARRKALTGGEIKQDEAAKLAGMDQQAWSRIERGAANPTLSTLVLICEALGVSLTELFEHVATRPLPPNTVNTTINLTNEERLAFGREANKRHLSLGEFIRRSINHPISGGGVYTYASDRPSPFRPWVSGVSSGKSR